jgi:predicted metallo-beta-lactamase superfamily hydrolase
VDSWQKLGDVVARVTDRLAPVVFTVEVSGPVAVALLAEAMKSGNRPETIIAEAVRAYMGDAA